MTAYHVARSTTNHSVKHLITESRWAYHVKSGGPLGGVCGEPAEPGPPVEPSRVCDACWNKAADKRYRALEKSVTIL